MPRSRNIKPGFFQDEDLTNIPFEYRLFLIGLWTLADREGRLEYRPKRIIREIFPYDKVDSEDCFRSLILLDVISLYEVNQIKYLQIRDFLKHQSIHRAEAPSVIPAPYGSLQNSVRSCRLKKDERAAVFERDDYKCVKCDNDRRLSVDHIIPLSKGGCNSLSNLQTLCVSCNSKKGASLLANHEEKKLPLASWVYSGNKIDTKRG